MPTTSPSARSTIGSTRRTTRGGSPPGSRAGRWREIVAPSFDEVVAAARSGLFDAIGHIDGVKRYVFPYVKPAAFEAEPDLYEPILHALVDSGTALEVNTSGLRYSIETPFPHPAIVARFRELGGRAVTVGSDAHRARPARAGAWPTAMRSPPRPDSTSSPSAGVPAPHGSRCRFLSPRMSMNRLVDGLRPSYDASTITGRPNAVPGYSL